MFEEQLVPFVNVGSMAGPAGATDCCPSVCKTTAAEFELVNPLKRNNFILAELVNGEVSFIVENWPKDGTGCPGKWMFDQMMGHFGASVTGVQGYWTGPFSDNLMTLNALTSAGVAFEVAARSTWTGKRAADWGLGRVQALFVAGSVGRYATAHVLFKK